VIYTNGSVIRTCSLSVSRHWWLVCLRLNSASNIDGRATRVGRGTWLGLSIGWVALG